MRRSDIRGIPVPWTDQMTNLEVDNTITDRVYNLEQKWKKKTAYISRCSSMFI